MNKNPSSVIYIERRTWLDNILCVTHSNGMQYPLKCRCTFMRCEAQNKRNPSPNIWVTIYLHKNGFRCHMLSSCCFFHCVAFDSPIPHFEISSNMTPSNSKSLAGHTKPLFENEWFRMPATYAHNHATVHANGCTNRIHFTFCIYQKSQWNSNTLRTRLSGINFSNLWPSPFKRMCTLFVDRDV